MWNLAFSGRCRAVTAKNRRKRRDARAKLIFIFWKPIAFLTFSLASPSDHKTPDVWKIWWASFVYPHFKGVEGDLGMFQGQFSKQYPFLNRKGNKWTNENYSKTSRLYKKYQTTLTILPIRENFECPFVVLQIILVTLSLAISFPSDGFY